MKVRSRIICLTGSTWSWNVSNIRCRLSNHIRRSICRLGVTGQVAGTSIAESPIHRHVWGRPRPKTVCYSPRKRSEMAKSTSFDDVPIFHVPEVMSRWNRLRSRKLCAIAHENGQKWPNRRVLTASQFSCTWGHEPLKSSPETKTVSYSHENGQKWPNRRFFTTSQFSCTRRWWTLCHCSYQMMMKLFLMMQPGMYLSQHISWKVPFLVETMVAQTPIVMYVSFNCLFP